MSRQQRVPVALVRRILRATRAMLVMLTTVLLVAVGSPRSAQAVPTPKAVGVPGVTAHIHPVLASDGTFFNGYSEFAVRIRNDSNEQMRGVVKAEAPQYLNQHPAFRATAPFAVSAGAKALIRVPVRVWSQEVTIQVTLDDGREVASQRFMTNARDRVFIVDLSQSALRSVLFDKPVPVDFTPMSSRASGPAGTVTVVGMPAHAEDTGDLTLPERAAGWAAADLVIIKSERLALLAGSDLQALVGHVLGGGTLAVTIDRPEHLREDTLQRLIGGAAERIAPDENLLLPLPAPPPRPGSGYAPTPPSGSGNMGAPPIPPGSLPIHAEAPLGDTAETLRSYRGGNLRPSEFGATASYGLGEVHLLGFDPTSRPAIDDPWVLERVLELARRGHDRRAGVVFRPGDDEEPQMYGSSDNDGIRKQLDPNEGARWAIPVATLLLLLYAALAGPLNFHLAAKRGRPLVALRRLPLFSLGAFVAIVLLGVAAKGISGRSRQLTLVEAGAGMSIGVARRYRGFYTPSSRELTIGATDASSVPSLVTTDTSENVLENVIVDRDGLRLDEVRALPWQTIIAREDGYTDLEGGISITATDPSDANSILIKNDSGRDLRGVLLRAPDGKSFYFDAITAGDTVAAGDGRLLGATADELRWLSHVDAGGMTAGYYQIHPLGGRYLTDVFPSGERDLVDAWAALEDAAQMERDWFPAGVPVLIGQLDGGAGKTHDGGLPIDRDRLLVRVVGFGGTP